MITLTEDQAKQVLAALDQSRTISRTRISPADTTWSVRIADRDSTAAIAIMRSALGVTEQGRAALVTKTALREHE